MDNPYAPPADDGAVVSPAGNAGYTISAGELVVSEGARLPKICLKTGRRGLNERSQQLVWIPLWARLLFGALGMLTSKKVNLTYFLSDEADHSRSIGTRVLIISLIAGIGTVAVAFALEMWAFALVALFGALGGMIVGARVSMPFRLRRIDDGKAYLRLAPEALRALEDHALRPRKQGRRRKKKRKNKPEAEAD
jgi:hypothetical protein